MNRTAVKNYAVRARRDFQKIVTERANALGISGKEIARAEPAGDMLTIKGRPFPKSIEMPRRELVSRVQRDGFDVVMEQMAYTLFNRFCALRFMEVNGYLPFRVFSSAAGDESPDIVKHAIEAAGALGVSDDKRTAITDLKLRGDQDQKLYSMLLLAQCNALTTAMPFLFERPNDVTEILMPDNLLHSDSVVRDLVAGIDEADWREIEIVGWLYQFYISEKKDQVIGKVVKKEDIPAATQLFTPKWIVQYMVENSLGRLWLQSHPDSRLKSRMPYYIDNPDDAKLQAGDILRVDTPDEIKCMDNCCGSGHVLVYMFDLLYAMYEEAGYIPKDIPRLILENNLHGLDIDERAAQLSAFALMMKARERDPKFLEHAVQPHVMAIEESNGLDLQADARIEGREQRSPFEATGSLIPDEGLLPTQQAKGGGDNPLKAFMPLVRFFHDAKNYGSLLRVPDALAGKLAELETRLAGLRGGDALFAGAVLPRLERLVRQAKMLARRYHAVATNPPYMGGKGMNAALKDFAKDQYPDSKSDLFAMFIEHCLEIVHDSGYAALVTMQSWMFLSSYERLRERLLDDVTIQCMVHMANMVMGIAFGTAATVWRNAASVGRRGHFSYVAYDDLNETNQPRQFPVQNERLSHASAADFKKIPGSPIAYWASERFLQVFSKGTPMQAYAVPRQGFATGNNDFFLRQWHEVNLANFKHDSLDTDDARISGVRWFPCNKGGSFRKWYGNNSFVADWKDDGAVMRRFPGSVIRNPSYYFKEGITWSTISSSSLSMRYSPPGFLFETKGSVCFPSSGKSYQVPLGLMNTKVVERVLLAVSPTLDFHEGPIGKVPVIEASPACVQPLVDCAINHAKRDWDCYETSWDFACQSLLDHSCRQPSLKDTYRKVMDQWQEMTQEMQRLEEENNRIFIEAYGLQDELTPDVPIEEITLTCNPVYRYGPGKTDEEYEQLQRADTMKELISYAVGCMMGRYSPDTPGLQFAGGTYDHEKACAAAPSFHPDADGILPVLTDAYFEADATARFAQFLKATFGPEHLSENLRFVAEAIGIKGSESPQDAIRRFLANDFFRYHMRMYKRRPIYWLFSSGKERAFQALVYLHRYTPSTLARMRTGYLHELQNKMRARIEDMEAGRDAATSTAQSNRINRDLTKLRKQLEELRVYDEKLHHYADQRIEIDLDDGVKNNYGLFGDLLAEVKDVTGETA